MTEAEPHGRRRAARAWAFAAFAITLSAESRAEATTRAQATAIVRGLDLANDREWRHLVHDATGFFGGRGSEVDPGEFFLSPVGAHDRAAELDATIGAFFAPLPAGPDDDHALCRFPLRREWLDEKLRPWGGLPRARCSELEAWLASVDATGVRFVYASQYFGNVASLFGHAFLRVTTAHSDRLGNGRTTGDWGIDYRADPTTANPLLYAIEGLGGMFHGHVRASPYDRQLERYVDEQARDLWEYDLSLSAAETRRLLLHVWELRRARIDFYYLTRNCAYEVLELLETAAPRLRLVDDLDAVVTPIDALHAVTRVPGLVKTVSYRGSSRRRPETHDASPRAVVSLPVDWDERPDLAHGPMRVTLGGGATTQYDAGFATLGYRLALHDLADPPRGSPELSQVVVLDTSLRYLSNPHALTLDRLTFVDLLSLRPLGRTALPVSFRVRAFGERLHDRDCPDCFAHGADGSVGATLATAGRRVAAFVMADAYVAFLPALSGFDRTFVRAGMGPFVGVRVRSGDSVAVLMGTLSWLPEETAGYTYDVRLTVRSAIGRDLALGVELMAQPLAVEGQLAAYVYF